MNKLRNIPFLIWFVYFLETIKPLKENIRKYKAQGQLESERAEIRKAEDAWADAVLRKAGIELNISSDGEIPEGPCVFVSNHQSYLDIPIYFAVIRSKQFGFVAKEELSKIPLFGSWIADVRSVFIQRDDARASLRAIEEGVELLKQGFSLVIFPEGTRSRSQEMAEFKKGSLRLATKAGVPVVPVTLSGSFRAFEEKGFIRPAKVNFHIHKVIETAGMDKAEVSNLSEKVETIVREKLNEFNA